MLNNYNFDCPDAFDVDCIANTLRRLKEGKSVDIPVYNFTTHRVEKQKVMKGGRLLPRVSVHSSGAAYSLARFPLPVRGVHREVGMVGGYYFDHV